LGSAWAPTPLCVVAGRAIAAHFGSHTFPESVQREIAAGLTGHDPAVVRNTIQRLRQTETGREGAEETRHRHFRRHGRTGRPSSLTGCPLMTQAGAMQ
jgi:hypothetical protein